MENLTTLEETVKTENKKLLIVPRYGLQQGAIYVIPQPDSHGGYKGIPHNWEELRKDGKVTTTPDDFFKFDIPSGRQYEFDLSIPAVAQRWSWMKHCPEIALTKEDAAANPNILLYVEDAEEEMNKTASVKKEKFELEKWVRDLIPTRQREVCRLLGQRTDFMKPIEIEDYLVEKARSGKYLDLKAVKEDTYFKTKLFLLELEDKKIILPHHKGYKYGETVLGLDVASCIHWLNLAENRETVLQWKRQLNMGFEGESFSIEKALTEEPKKPIALSAPVKEPVKEVQTQTTKASA